MLKTFSSDAILSAIIAISVFVLGYILNRIYDVYKENKRLEKVKTFYFETLKFIVSELGIEDRNYRKLEVKLINHKVTNFNLVSNHNLVFESLDYVSDDDLFKSLKLDKKKESKDLEKFRDLIFSVSFLRNTQKRTKENFIDFTDRFFELQQLWGEEFEDLFEQIRRLRIDVAQGGSSFKNSINTQLLQGINEILSNWFQKEDFKNYQTSYIELLIPLMDHLREYMTDERVLAIYQNLSRCNHLYSNMENLRSFYREEFSLDRENINKRKEKLEEVINYFYSKPT